MADRHGATPRVTRFNHDGPSSPRRMPAAHERERLVVLLCGPAGAGKTTAAHQSGLAVFDRDDPQWESESQFRSAISALAHNPTARAVVIRAGASSSARAKTAALIGATHVYMLTTDPRELRRRVAHRGRADKQQGLASIHRWHEQHDRKDGVANFPGWQNIHRHTAARSNSTGFDHSGPSRTRSGERYDSRHANARRDAARHHQPQHPCARCGHRLGPMGPWLHYDHTDDGTSYLGFSHGTKPCDVCGQRCNVTAGAKKASQKAHANHASQRWSSQTW